MENLHSLLGLVNSELSPLLREVRTVYFGLLYLFKISADFYSFTDTFFIQKIVHVICVCTQYVNIYYMNDASINVLFSCVGCKQNGKRF